MDEIEKAALEATAKAIRGPVTKVVSDAIGVAGGDKLAAYRARKQLEREAAQAAVAEEARKLLRNRGVEPDPNTPPEWIEEILEAAQDNTIIELRDLYARLIAAAADPSRRSHYRREFVEVIQAMEPLDIIVLPKLNTATGLAPTRMVNIASHIGATEDQVALSFRKLLALELVDEPTNETWQHKPRLTALGRQFLRAVTD